MEKRQTDRNNVRVSIKKNKTQKMILVARDDYRCGRFSRSRTLYWNSAKGFKGVGTERWLTQGLENVKSGKLKFR